MYYHIRVKGHLDPSWQDEFEGLLLGQEEGATRLSGWLQDQAALYGILLKLRALGLTLLSLESDPAPQDEAED